MNRTKLIRQSVRSVIASTLRVTWNRRLQILGRTKPIKRSGKSFHRTDSARKRWHQAALIKTLRKDPAIRVMLKHAIHDLVEQRMVNWRSRMYQRRASHAGYNRRFSKRRGSEQRY